jgi:hypothetical protein
MNVDEMSGEGFLCRTKATATKEIIRQIDGHPVVRHETAHCLV